MAAREQAFSSFPSSSSSPSTIRWNYDVFLSFRGEDTRRSFTDHLYNSLIQAGIHTFRDNEELDRGEWIGRKLPVAIEESRISIIVFSKNYASSTWCLRELVKILECRTEPIEQTVLPIFLVDADPSDIRKQGGSFAEALSRHEEHFEREVVDKWRVALREAAELSGFTQKDDANGYESKLIQLVVKWVLSKFNIVPLDVAKCPVGINSRVEDMMKLLDYLSAEPKLVKIVGICGMGGIGKTTIAKAVYNQIFRTFESSSFLEDVRESSKQHNGLIILQNQLLSDILKQEIQLISNVNKGKGLIRERVCAKKVLVVLDDVDKNDQLQALAGALDWFGSGSRIIITTRDKHVLKVHQVKEDEIYEPKELNFQQSLQLFSNHAFGRSQPLDDYIELAKNVVHTASGLPLALEVLGSFLFERRKNEWESTLEKLKKIPPEEVQAKLKISYDALEDQDKGIFLDIACFFTGTNIEYANYRLESCNLYFDIGIAVLIEKSLVKIGIDNGLRMHDQLRDMGREIVRKESLDEPGKRSRLWSHEEALYVLKEHTGTRNVKGLLINFDQKKKTMSKEHYISTETFTAMSNLKFLQIDGAHLVGDFKHLPSELRCLNWRRCLLEFLPTNFHLEKLVVLDLSLSKISQVWDMLHQNKLFANLKVLNLSSCHFLTSTPHFSGIPNLEILNLQECGHLVKVHGSIGNLKRLVLLNLRYCTNIVELPSSICMLSSLQNLLLTSCFKLVELPEELGSMVSLTELASSTAIEKTPESIGLLKNHAEFHLNGVGSLTKLPNSLSRLESLTNLESSGTRITEYSNFHGCLNKLQLIDLTVCASFKRIPGWIGKAINLTCLRLDHTIITELPNAIGLLENLNQLSVTWCRKLVKLPDSIGKMKCLQYLYMRGSSIVKLPEDFGELSSLMELDMTCCEELESLPKNFGNLTQLRTLYVTDCNLSEGAIPSDIGKLSSLQRLYLSGNNFYSLPRSISDLSLLEKLHLANCTNLRVLPAFPLSLEELDVTNCLSMERFPNVSNLKNLQSLFLANCIKLQSLPANVCNLAQPDAANCMSNTLSSIQILVQQGLFEHLRSLSFHGGNIPDWFIPVQFSQDQGTFISGKIRKSSVVVAQPELLNPDNEITGLIICFSFAFKEKGRIERGSGETEVVIGRKDETIPTGVSFPTDFPFTYQDHDQIYFYQEEIDSFVHVLNDVTEIQFSIELDSELKRKIDVKKGGIYLVYSSKEDTTTMRQSTYKRLADFFTSCDGFVSDGMSRKKELPDLNAIEFSASSNSIEGKADRLQIDGSNAKGPNNDQLDLSLSLATPDSLYVSSSKKHFDADNDWDLLPPKTKKPKKDPPLDLNKVDFISSS